MIRFLWSMILVQTCILILIRIWQVLCWFLSRYLSQWTSWEKEKQASLYLLKLKYKFLFSLIRPKKKGKNVFINRVNKREWKNTNLNHIKSLLAFHRTRRTTTNQQIPRRRMNRRPTIPRWGMNMKVTHDSTKETEWKRLAIPRRRPTLMIPRIEAKENEQKRNLKSHAVEHKQKEHVE